MNARKRPGVEFPDLYSIRQSAAPMEARSAESLPNEPGTWQFEPKWDGFRCLAFKNDGAVELKGKSGTSLSRFFPEVVETLLDVPFEQFVVDGELVIELNGRITFDALQIRLHPAASRIRRCRGNAGAIDPVRHAGRPDGARPDRRSLTDRRQRARGLWREGGEARTARRHALHPGPRAGRRMARRLIGGTDGVVAKRLTAPMQSGERAMIKVKRLRTADCVVGGFRYESVSREVGSSLLGLYDADGRLDHVGFTSTIAERRTAGADPAARGLAGAARLHRQRARRARAAGARNAAANGSRCGRNSWSKCDTTT